MHKNGTKLCFSLTKIVNLVGSEKLKPSTKTITIKILCKNRNKYQFFLKTYLKMTLKETFVFPKLEFLVLRKPQKSLLTI